MHDPDDQVVPGLLKLRVEEHENSTKPALSPPTTQKTPVPQPPQLATLPPEIHLLLFHYLADDPITSTCLGLTCKNLYPVHRSFQGTVPLWTPEPSPLYEFFFPSPSCPSLWERLEDWFPEDMNYNWEIGKYVGEKAYREFLVRLKGREEGLLLWEKEAEREREVSDISHGGNMHEYETRDDDDGFGGVGDGDEGAESGSCET
jgi:hypothetical protein